MARQPLDPNDVSTTVTARMPSKVADRLEAVAAMRGVRRSNLVRQAVEAFLAEHEGEEHTAA